MKDQLDPKQEKAIAALLTHNTQKEAAMAVRIPLRTLENWLTQAPFQNALHDALVEAIRSGGRGLAALQIPAMMAMKSVMEHPEAPGASIKLKAATKILEMGNQYLELIEYEARIKALEEKAKYVS